MKYIQCVSICKINYKKVYKNETARYLSKLLAMEVATHYKQALAT